jgi:aconitate decarboxylase
MTSTSNILHDAKPGPTQQLSTWVSSINLDQVPQNIRIRAKYLILDGLACALVGAHLPWSEKAANAILDMEPAGDSTVFGWNRKIGPVSAALINSTFIQGFELDDFHSAAPLHSNSILIPAILGASQHLIARQEATVVSGSDFLLSMIVGYEVGPRVGLALHGPHVLSQGWHSGAVFGPAAAAAAVGRLIGLSASQIEDAFGIACTQACGLMSAQFGSEVKRMQHGFASRNGLLAALLAKGGYVGIRGVFEHEYGGFLKQFSLGNGKTPQYMPTEIVKELGQTWTTEGVRVKPYASMGGTHPTIDCIRKLQENYPKQMQNVKAIKWITIEMGEAAFNHGGWKAARPLTSTGAQMSNAYIAATQILDRQVLPAQFRCDMLERDEVWRLVDLTQCERAESLDSGYAQIVTIEFDNQPTLKQRVEGARGVNPPLANDEILEKWRLLSKEIIDTERRDNIE